MTTINVDFAVEAQALLRVLGTGVEEGRISLELGALQLSALHARHGIHLSEVGAGIVLARWCGARPATPPGHPLHVASPSPSQEVLQLAMLRAQIGLLNDLASIANGSTGSEVSGDELLRQLDARVEALHGLGYRLDIDGEVVPA